MATIPSAVDETAGPATRDALLSLFGTLIAQIEELIALLQANGVISAEDWDTAMHGRFASMANFDEWARRHLDPEDNAALDAFFGGS
jgi:hypothetical protein